VVNRPSVPEIITVNSEALQTQIRDLLPSQNGFGSELQASNVITPIIDLTRAAEGSTVPEQLQTALAFGSQTAFDVVNTTTVLINTTGFYRVFGTAGTFSSTGSRLSASFSMSDGATNKTIWAMVQETNSVGTVSFIPFDFVVFLRAGDSLSAIANSADTNLVGSHRQIATGDGGLVSPVGFPV